MLDFKNILILNYFSIEDNSILYFRSVSIQAICFSHRFYVHIISIYSLLSNNMQLKCQPFS